MKIIDLRQGAHGNYRFQISNLDQQTQDNVKV